MREWMVSLYGKEIRVELVPVEYDKDNAKAYLIGEEDYSEDITIEEVKPITKAR